MSAQSIHPLSLSLSPSRLWGFIVVFFFTFFPHHTQCLLDLTITLTNHVISSLPLSFQQAPVRAQRKVTTAAVSEPGEMMVRLSPTRARSTPPSVDHSYYTYKKKTPHPAPQKPVRGECRMVR